jgi:hypothetical protein
MTTFFNRNRIEGEDFVPQEQICSCNRRTSPPHCRKCGSAFKYVRLSESKVITIPSLSSTEPERKIIVKRFVCRNCGSAYFEDTPCNAPELVHLPSREEQAAIRRNIREKLGGSKKSSVSSTGKDVLDLVRHLQKQFPANENLKRMAGESDPKQLAESAEISSILDDKPIISQEEQEEFEKWQKGE